MKNIAFNTFIMAFALFFHSPACDARHLSNVSVATSGNGGISSMRTLYSEPIYTTADEMPQFPGGAEALYGYIKKEIRYPQKCRKAKIEGCTSVIFVVTSKGRITDVKVRQSSGNKKLDREAVRVVRKMPRFTPAKLNNENVSVMLTLPVVFKLDEQDL